MELRLSPAPRESMTDSPAAARRPADPAERLARSQREFGEYGGVNASIECSTTFTVLEADTLPDIFAGAKGPEGGCYLYGRSFNPTVRYLGRQLAAIEGTEAAYCTASGMGAISSALLALCASGDHIVASNTVYGGTHALLNHFLPNKCGITTTFVNITDLAAVEVALTRRTRVVYTESVSNPTLAVADLPALARLARGAGTRLVVDNTFAPVVLSPAAHGADVVVHSLTKFVSGSSDIIAGAICGPAKFIDGPTMDPKVASQLSLRIPHLALRMREHSARALRLAQGLWELGAKVTYPGLACHPQHALLRRMANPGYGAGGMLTLEMPSLAAAKALMERLQNKHSFGLMAVSLGYMDTLMSAPAVSTSSELGTAELAAAGIAPGLVRMSVGLTGGLEQRWEQLREAYLHVMRAHARAAAARPGAHTPALKAATEPGAGAGAGAVRRTPSWPSLGSDVSEATDADGSESEAAGP
eukprot:scaffold2.g7420.t1